MNELDIYTLLYSGAQYGIFFLRIVLACLCGAAIGFERTKRLKEAGMRTHIIVCCTAALVMIVSKYGFADMLNGDEASFLGTRGADPARLAAQVVSGISFLCAGVIFKNGSTVKGLTTAAGLWGTACIGLAIGSGMWIVGIFATVMISILQVVMHKFTVGADSYTNTRLRFAVRDDDSFRAELDELLEQWEVQISDCQIRRLNDDLVEYDIALKTRKEITVNDLQEIMSKESKIERMAIIPGN